MTGLRARRVVPIIRPDVAVTQQKIAQIQEAILADGTVDARPCDGIANGEVNVIAGIEPAE